MGKIQPVVTLNDLRVVREQVQDPLAYIRQLEHEIALDKVEIAKKQGILDFMRQQYADNLIIRWREEVRKCLGILSGEYRIATFSDVLGCIEWNNGIQADKVMKNKVITTLSMMHKEGEIGKAPIQGHYYYGYKELFDDTLMRLKKEYLHLLDE
jgi:hypothetical protein